MNPVKPTVVDAPTLEKMQGEIRHLLDHRESAVYTYEGRCIVCAVVERFPSCVVEVTRNLKPGVTLKVTRADGRTALAWMDDLPSSDADALADALTSLAEALGPEEVEVP